MELNRCLVLWSGLLLLGLSWPAQERNEAVAISQGVYEAELPAGKYQVEAGYRHQKVKVEVVADTSVPPDTTESGTGLSPGQGASAERPSNGAYFANIVRDAVVVVVVLLRWRRRQDRPSLAEAAVQAWGWVLVFDGATLGGGVLLSRLLGTESIGPFRFVSFWPILLRGLIGAVLGLGLIRYNRAAWVVATGLAIATLLGVFLVYWLPILPHAWWSVVWECLWAGVWLWALLQQPVRDRVWRPELAITGSGSVASAPVATNVTTHSSAPGSGAVRQAGRWSSAETQFRVLGIGLTCLGVLILAVGVGEGLMALEGETVPWLVFLFYLMIALLILATALGVYRATTWGWVLAVVLLNLVLYVFGMVFISFVVLSSQRSMAPFMAPLVPLSAWGLWVLLRKQGRDLVWSRRHLLIEETQQHTIGALEQELRTAHEMQMGLMPKEPPRITGFEITGRCTPASHVGGDLFQFFPQHDKLFIGLADVTGHAMAAAIPVVMFSGVLRSHMGTGSAVEELFGKLNQALYGALSRHTLVCLAMGELDPATRRFRFSNAGCPYPYHYQATMGKIVELQVDAYPLGARPNTTYRAIETQLEPGDRVVFCSDGIIEAANMTEEMFGFERTAETIRRGCVEDLSAEALLARIIQEVKAFSGEVPQGDDQTVVVLKVER